MTRQAHARAQRQPRPHPSWLVKPVDTLPCQSASEQNSVFFCLFSRLQVSPCEEARLLTTSCFSSFPFSALPLHQGLRSFLGRARFSLEMRKACGISGRRLDLLAQLAQEN